MLKSSSLHVGRCAKKLVLHLINEIAQDLQNTCSYF